MKHKTQAKSNRRSEGKPSVVAWLSLAIGVMALLVSGMSASLLSNNFTPHFFQLHSTRW